MQRAILLGIQRKGRDEVSLNMKRNNAASALFSVT